MLRTGIFLVIAIAVAATVLIAFFATRASSPSTSELFANGVTPVSAHYLTYYPSHLTYGGNETKIFLLSADARYGSYNQSFQTLFGGEVHKGDACFIINVTIRNDYTKEQHGPGGYSDRPDDPFPSGYFISLTAQLYNKEGQAVGRVMTPPPLLGSLQGGFIETSLKTGETTTFDIYVAYEKQDIDHYELYIFNIGPAPTP